jgi:hypothetical protein
MPRSILRKTLLACTIALAALPASAQGGPLATSEPTEQRIRDAFATPSADALLKTFVKSVRKNADSACLQEKAFDDATLAGRGSALMQRYGGQMLKLMDDSFDRAAYEKAFTDNAGPRAISELEQLRRDGDVKKLIALERPAALARLVVAVTENFDHYITIGRIKLDQISPAARGEEEPKENPIEAAEAAAQKFIDTHSSKKRINRYLDLAEAADEARRKAMATPAAMKLGPMAYFAGADRDLAELCVGPKPSAR